MIEAYNKVDACSQINLKKDEIEPVQFQNYLPFLSIDSLSEKIKSYVNEKTIYKDVDYEIKNTKQINNLAIKVLFSLIKLGVNYSEYQKNPTEFAFRFFKGKSIIEKLKDYSKRSESSNIQEKIILKILVCNLILKENIKNIVSLSKSLLVDKDIAKLVINQDGLYIQYLKMNLRHDKDIVLAAVKQNGLAIGWASRLLQSDEDVILEAIKQNGLAFEWISSPDLKYDKELALIAVKQNGLAIQHIPVTIIDYKELVLEAIKQNGLAFELISLELKSNKELALIAVRQNGFAIKHIPVTIIDYEELVLEAIKQDVKVIKLISKDLQSKNIVLTAVKQNGFAIKYAIPLFINDLDIILSSNKQIAFQIISKINSTNVKEIVCGAGSDTSSESIQIYEDQIKQLIESYEKFKNDAYSNNAAADHYIKMIIEGKTKKADKAKSYILNQIKQNKLIKDPQKEEYIQSIVSHLELEAICLKAIGLESYKNLRIIFPMIKKIMGYRDEFVKKYFIKIMKGYSGECLKCFLEKLSRISGGKIDLILPSIILSTLNINEDMQNDLYKCLENKSNIFGNKNKLLLKSLINLEEKLIDIYNEKDGIKIVEIIKSLFVEDCNLIIKKINLLWSIAVFNPHKITKIKDFSFNNLLKIVIDHLTKVGVFDDASKSKIDVFLESRIPHAIFTYASKFLDNLEMIPIIKKFIDQVTKNTFKEFRYENNSHKHLLNESQKVIWQTGASEPLYRIDSQYQLFDPIEFLTTKLIQYNHDDDELERVKISILFGAVIFEPTQVESLCIELLNKYDPIDQLEILKRLQIALMDKKYENIKFKDDVNVQISAMDKISSAESLIIKDTDDWQDLFLCGTEVLGSCQAVDERSINNQCLLGYVLDGKIRMIKIQKNDGSTVSRSIIKIMKDHLGRPALFLEKSYPDDKHFLTIKNFAKKRAKELSMNLYEYKDNGLIKLQSEGNIALFEYEDAECGMTSGCFEVQAKLIK